MDTNNNIITKLSSHLFWDTDPQKIDISRHEKFIIGRVLQYGLLQDLEILLKIYGINEIAQISSGIKSLDKKTASFIALIANKPKNDFACYTTIPSQKTFWNF